MRILLEALRHEIERGGARPQAIDGLIAELPDGRGPEDTAALLSLLSDGAPDDAGMFSILHAAEATDDAGYVAGLLASVPDLSATAPRWASIVLMRALNHAGTRHALVRQLREVPAPVRDAIRTMSERIEALDPDFLDRTAPVIAAAGPGRAP